MKSLVFFLLSFNLLIGQSLDMEIAALKDSILLYKNSDPDKPSLSDLKCLTLRILIILQQIYYRLIP